MLKITFYKKQEIAKDTWQLFFIKPRDFVFKAGQYTTLFLDKDNRDFTICSNEHEKEFFSIVTKIGLSDFKKNLFSLADGSGILMKEPAGGFVLNSNNVPKVLLAGGIGMTPFYSMIVSNKNTKIPLTLIMSFQKKENIIFYDELKQIASENKWIKIIYTLSQEKWEGEDGRISEKLIKKYIQNITEMEFMIAGGEKMVEDTEELVLSMGVQSEKIRIDIFTGY